MLPSDGTYYSQWYLNPRTRRLAWPSASSASGASTPAAPTSLSATARFTSSSRRSRTLAPSDRSDPFRWASLENRRPRLATRWCRRTPIKWIRYINQPHDPPNRTIEHGANMIQRAPCVGIACLLIVAMVGCDSNSGGPNVPTVPPPAGASAPPPVTAPGVCRTTPLRRPAEAGGAFQNQPRPQREPDRRAPHPPRLPDEMKECRWHSHLTSSRLEVRHAEFAEAHEGQRAINRARLLWETGLFSWLTKLDEGRSGRGRPAEAAYRP